MQSDTVRVILHPIPDIGEQKELHKEAGVSSLRPTDGKFKILRHGPFTFSI
jgi:hypothetical protein